MNAIMTHSNNVFRMQVAVGMDLQAFYCEDTVEALRDAQCLNVFSNNKVTVNANSLDCRDLLKDASACEEEYISYNLQESLSRLCTRELIDFYDCAYPAGDEQDMIMSQKMWDNNLSQAQKAQAAKTAQNDSEQDFLK